LKVLFISHESSRTGAPLVLLSFLKWLKQNQSDIACDLVSLKTGELREEFENVVDSYQELRVEIPEELTLIQLIKRRLLKRLGLFKIKKTNLQILLEELTRKKPEVIYANSALSLDVALALKKTNPKAKLICHIHELETIIKISLPAFKEQASGVDKWIAVSELVKNNLIVNYSIAPPAIETVYEFTDSITLKERALENNSEFIVGGCGTVHWRKGTDLFIQVARYTKHKYPELPIKFMWVGELSSFQETLLAADIHKSNLNETVEFTGHTSNPSPYFERMSLFLLTSREDPFPLVAIEAGKLGKPIIAFDKASGTTEFLSDTCGCVVNYMDVEAMAEQVVYYFQNPDILELHNKTSKHIFSQLNPEKCCPQLYNVIVEND